MIDIAANHQMKTRYDEEAYGDGMQDDHFPRFAECVVGERGRRGQIT